MSCPVGLTPPTRGSGRESSESVALCYSFSPPLQTQFRVSVNLPEPSGAGSRICPLRNLAPADLRKDASGFDLVIEAGLLSKGGQAAFDWPGNENIVSTVCWFTSGRAPRPDCQAFFYTNMGGNLDGS